MFAQIGTAADNPLHYFKNYFVTGDYAVGGVGLRGKGAGGMASGTINMSGVPTGADLVAALLYWQTVENTATPSAMNGLFDNHKIVGAVLGDPQNAACGNFGQKGRVYRADVLRFLAVDKAKSVRIANGPHLVSLPDGGPAPNSLPLTNGATLVVIYRIVVPGNPAAAPLRAVVIYDGAFTLGRRSDDLEQTIKGFYQTTSNPAAKITHIVSNGQPNWEESLRVNDSFLSNHPFTGAQGTRWDNPTFNFNLPPNASSLETDVSGDDDICLTWGAIVTSMKVQDSDRDGLLDVWESRGVHVNPGDASHEATFGGCADYPRERCVNLPAMGALNGTPDIFVEIDWMHEIGTAGGPAAHEHKPKLDALAALAATFRLHNYAVHFDVGNNYQGNTFIVPAALAQGGEIIEENPGLLCPNAATRVCAFMQPYSALSWKIGFQGVRDGAPKLGIPPHFVHDRWNVFHYVLFGHALAIPGGSPPGSPKSVSGVADRPGGDLMVTLGLWSFDVPEDKFVGSVKTQLGTLMHELGHNLGLSHAGVYRTPNCMPNYQSVMNYQYQTRLLSAFDGSKHADFSYGKQGALNENLLSETLSLPVGPPTYKIRHYGPFNSALDSPDSNAKVRCDGTLASGPPMVRLENDFTTFVDWNHDHAAAAAGVLYSIDVDFNGSLNDGPLPTGYLVDSNDWANLNLQQVGARLNMRGLSSGLGETDLGETDLGETDLGETDLGETDLGETDLGELDFEGYSLGSLEPPPPATPDCPTCGLKSINKIDRITLTWTAPDGHVDTYNVYRTDAAHLTPFKIASIPGGVPALTFDDVINATTPTVYNTTYTYYVTSAVLIGDKSQESPPSATASGIVKHLFITADAKSRIYGDAEPAFTHSVAGLDPPEPTGIVCTTTTTAMSDIGPYTIHCTGPGTTSNPIDGISYIDGTLTINKRSVTPSVTASDKVYDGGLVATSVCTLSNVTPFDTGNGNVTCSGTAKFPLANVGNTYVVTVTGIGLAGAKSNNYMLTINTAATGATVKITPKSAAVTPAASSKTYGDPDPALTGALSGFLDQDIVTATYSRAPGVNVGPYVISAVLNAAGTPGLLSNYSVTYNTGTFTVNQKPASVAPAANSKIHGTPDPVPLTTGILSGFLPADGVTATYSRAPGSAGGMYAISATLTANPGLVSNYNVTVIPANFTITPETQSISFLPLDNKPKNTPDFLVHATATSGLAVTFTASDSDDCTVTMGGLVHLVNSGSCKITAHQAGDPSYFAAGDISQSFYITESYLGDSPH